MQTVTTTKGDMTATEISPGSVEYRIAGEVVPVEKKTGTSDEPAATIDWIEYWFNGGTAGPELIHRSAHATLKLQPSASGVAEAF